MRSTVRILVVSALGVPLFPAVALAGMPSINLSDVAEMRVQSISFFLVGFLVSAWAICAIWNRLQIDWPFLPRLTYGKALGVVFVWGLLFVLVLTMISGARELLTPGAWEKQGKTYRLAQQDTVAPAPEPVGYGRKEKLDRLRLALWVYAESHQGRFPLDREDTAIPKECWQTSDDSGMRYLYVKGQVAGQGNAPLAYEPEIFGAGRWVLFTNGNMLSLDNEQLLRALPKEGH